MTIPSQYYQTDLQHYTEHARCVFLVVEMPIRKDIEVESNRTQHGQNKAYVCNGVTRKLCQSLWYASRQKKMIGDWSGVLNAKGISHQRYLTPFQYALRAAVGLSSFNLDLDWEATLSHLVLSTYQLAFQTVRVKCVLKEDFMVKRMRRTYLRRTLCAMWFLESAVL